MTETNKREKRAKKLLTFKKKEDVEQFCETYKKTFVFYQRKIIDVTDFMDDHPGKDLCTGA
jgi:hypothetical protein